MTFLSTKNFLAQLADDMARAGADEDLLPPVPLSIPPKRTQLFLKVDQDEKKETGGKSDE